MEHLILKDIDVVIVSYLYLEDVYNLKLTNTYFKSLCDETLYDKIDDVNRLADNLTRHHEPFLKVINKLPMDIFQKIILFTRTDSKMMYNLLKNCANCYAENMYLSKKARVWYF